MTKENITSKDVEQIIKQPVVRPSVLNSREPIKNKYPDIETKTKEDLNVYQELVDTLTDDSFLDATTTRTRKNIKECLVNTLKRKYKMSNGELAKTVEGLLELHGMADKNFDPLARKADFLASKLNDISIDDNANKSEKTMKALYTELSLAFSKLDGYDSIYKVLVELYGKQKAKQLTGDLYDYSLAMNDSTNITIPYCYCMDASKLVTVGKSFGKVHSSPARSISTYVSVLTDLVREFSFNIAGACAIGTFFLDIANLLIYVERVTLKELKENKEVQKYVKNCFQKVIYSVNHYSRNASESPFTNISCFDYTKLKTLINKDNYKWYYPQKLKVLLDNGLVEEASNSSDQKYTCSEEAWDNFVIDYIMTLQEMFLDIFDKGDPLRDGTQFPFPVTTLNLSVAVDDKGKRALVEENVFGKGNRLEKFIVHKDPIKYNIYASEGTKMASCCFSGKQKVLVRNAKHVYYIPFEEAYKLPRNATNYSVFHNGSWVKGNPIKLDGRKLYKVTTSNKKELILTDNHINVTQRGDVTTDKLTTKDYLMFSTLPLKHTCLKDECLTYSQGYLVGLFLGDGSICTHEGNKVQDGKYRTVNFSLSEPKIHSSIPELKKAVTDLGVDKEPVVHATRNGCTDVAIHSPVVTDFIRYWTNWNTNTKSFNKELNLDCLMQSIEFREGILQGWYDSDGGNSDRFYSTSKKLIDCMEVLCTSLGLITIIDVDDRTDEVRIIRGKEYSVNYPLYCLRVYRNHWRGTEYSRVKSRSMPFEIIKNNSVFMKVESIEEVNQEDSVYCFEVKNQDEPYFTLPNGIITHNCRLLSDTEAFGDFAGSVNSFGGSSVSLGSARVVTLNFARAALEATSYDHFKKIILERVDSIAKILKAHRILILKLKDKGYQPFLANGMINFNRMFGTFGALGYLEADKMLKEKFGNEDFDYLKDFMVFFNKACTEKFQEKDENGKKIYNFPFNIEQIPGESMAPKLAKADKLVFKDADLPELYANQFTSLWEDKTIDEKLRRDGELGLLLTGGGIVHIQVNSNVTAPQAHNLIKKAVSYGCAHFAINGTWSYCEHDSKKFEGNLEDCPICGKKLDHYTRVIGYFSKVEDWNKTRRQYDFPGRKFTNLKPLSIENAPKKSRKKRK